jgi:hypothetical protein
MSLAGFQRAMVDLAASAPLRARVREEGAEALSAYALTEVERRRLLSAVDQRGMTVNGMLYRSNRLAPINSQLPYSLMLIGPRLRETMDAYWAENPRFERNAPLEVRRFGAFVRRRMDEGALDEALLGDVLAWERAVYELALLPPERTRADVAEAVRRARPDRPLRPHPLVEVCAFRVDPAALLPHLFAKRRPPYDDVRPGDHHLLVDFRGPDRQFLILAPEVAAAFRVLRDGGWLDPGDAAVLINLGLAIADED